MAEIINFVLEYWYILVAFLACGAFGGIKAYLFVKLSPDDQMAKIKEMIYSLVLEAEKLLGSSTGEAKFAQVISWIYERFPFDLVKLISQEQLKELIEDAVTRMKEYFEKNPKGAQNILGK